MSKPYLIPDERLTLCLINWINETPIITTMITTPVITPMRSGVKYSHLASDDIVPAFICLRPILWHLWICNSVKLAHPEWLEWEFIAMSDYSHCMWLTSCESAIRVSAICADSTYSICAFCSCKDIKTLFEDELFFNFFHFTPQIQFKIRAFSTIPGVLSIQCSTRI